MCLRNNTDAWRRIDAPDYVLEWIINGVPIPFVSGVEPFELKNRTFNRQQTAFIDSEIDRLLSTGYVEKCVSKPTCISPLSVVPKRNNKYRLVTDLRHLNSFCATPKYRNEDIREAAKLY